MGTRTTIALMLMGFVAACGGGANNSDDFCSRERRYGDGVCDRDCPHFDRDCEGLGGSGGGGGQGGGGGGVNCGAMPQDPGCITAEVAISYFAPERTPILRGETVALSIGTTQHVNATPEFQLELISGSGRVYFQDDIAYYEAGTVVGTASIRLIATVPGATDEATTVVDVINVPPMIESFGAPNTGFPGVPLSFTVVASDTEDGTTLSYAFELLSGAGSFTGSGLATQFVPGVGFAGEAMIRVTVTDSEGGTSTRDVSIWIDGTPAPTLSIISSAGNAFTVGGETTLVSETNPPSLQGFYSWRIVSGSGTLSGGLSNYQTFASSVPGTVVIEGAFEEVANGRITTATIQIDVVDNHDPVASDFTFGADLDIRSWINWQRASAYQDDDVAALSVVVVADGLHGAFTVQNETLFYMPDNTFTTTDSATLRIEDGLGGEVTITVGVQARVWQSIAGHNLGGYGIKSDGSLWAWGANASGELGQGTRTINAVIPLRIGEATDWEQVYAGGNYGFAIKTDGSLWGWGANLYGAIGNGTTNDVLTPIPIGAGFTWKHVGIGRFHTLAVRSDGSLWAWGRNQRGQLCLGDTVDRDTPARVGTDNDWEQVGGGFVHSVMLKDDGSLWSCGHNNVGQLGNGARSVVLGDGSFFDNQDSLTPVAVNGSVVAVSLSVGWEHTLALTANGSLYGWGKNLSGQLGQNTTTGAETSPLQIPGTWLQASAGLDHSLGIADDGSLWSWGYNNHGQLGLGDRTLIAESPPGSGMLMVVEDHDRLTPQQVGNATDWTQVLASTGWSAALAGPARYGWGDNDNAVLGLGPFQSGQRLTPVLENLNP